jgi:glucuronosyltransferase
MLPFTLACLSLALLLSFHGVQCGEGASGDITDSCPRDEEGNCRSLNVLMISTWLSGHQMHLLGVGEELVNKGHKVAFLSTEVNGSRVVPHVPLKMGMRFISAGPDPRSKADYEKRIYDLMGLSVFWQRVAFIPLIDDHMLLIRKALDQLNGSEWDIVLADFTHCFNIVRYLSIKWPGVKIVISASSIMDYPSIAPPWPYPTMYIVGASVDLSFPHRVLGSLFYQVLFSNMLGTYWVKSYLAGNDTELWNVVRDDPYFYYSPDLLYPMLYFSAIGLEYAHTHHPTVHMVGPMLSKNAVALQPELQDWLDKKQNKDVVYISMGTTALLTPEMASGLLKGIQSTRYSVVWSLRKSNQNVLEGLEIDKSRVLISEWVPQIALLQHPAIRMAVLHCGGNGLHESMSNGIPVICIPFSFDQFSWANKIGDQGVGVAISAGDVSHELVHSTIKKIDSGGYYENARKLSKILKHAGGARRAAELMEYYADVGYDHLIPAYIKYRWGWRQYYNLDVYGLLLAVLGILVYVSCRIFRFFCSCLSGGKVKTA